MMGLRNKIMAEREQSDRPNAALHMVLAALGLLFTGGAATGFLIAHFEDGGSLSAAGLAALAAIILLGVYCIYVLLRSRLTLGSGPIGQSEKRSRTILWQSGVLGAVISIVIIGTGAITGTSDPFGGLIHGRVTLHPAIAVILLVLICGVLPWLTWQWHCHIDEHELRAISDGALVAGYAMLIAIPAWYITAAAGWTIKPDLGITLLLYSLLWLAIWLYRKFG
jgi:hypothetical protein